MVSLGKKKSIYYSNFPEADWILSEKKIIIKLVLAVSVEVLAETQSWSFLERIGDWMRWNLFTGLSMFWPGPSKGKPGPGDV